MRNLLSHIPRPHIDNQIGLSGFISRSCTIKLRNIFTRDIKNVLPKFYITQNSATYRRAFPDRLQLNREPISTIFRQPHSSFYYFSTRSSLRSHSRYSSPTVYVDRAAAQVRDSAASYSPRSLQHCSSFISIDAQRCNSFLCKFKLPTPCACAYAHVATVQFTSQLPLHTKSYVLG